MGKRLNNIKNCNLSIRFYDKIKIIELPNTPNLQWNGWRL